MTLKKVLFLDFDGVLNHEEYYDRTLVERLTKPHRVYAEESAENDIHPNPEFEAYMQNLCEEHDRMLEEGFLDDIHGPYEC